MYYLNDHERVEYNNSGWPATPKGDWKARNEAGINDSKRITTAGGAVVVGRARPPIGLLSVRMREYREKEKGRNNGFANGDTSKERRFASPGVPSAPFLHILLTLVAEQLASAPKADILQGPPSIFKYSQVPFESNVEPHARRPLAAANTNANARRNTSKPSSKPGRGRVNHATEEKENHPPISADSDNEVEDRLQTAHALAAQKNPSKEQAQKQEYLFANIDTLPDPFILTSGDESDDSLEGEQSEMEGVTATDSDTPSVTTAEPADERNAWGLKSCLRGAKVPSKGHTVSFKDPLIKFHFYHYPDPDDIWSRCGLSMRPTRKSFASVLLSPGHSPASYSQTPAIRYCLSKDSPCYVV